MIFNVKKYLGLILVPFTHSYASPPTQ